MSREKRVSFPKERAYVLLKSRETKDDSDDGKGYDQYEAFTSYARSTSPSGSIAVARGTEPP